MVKCGRFSNVHLLEFNIHENHESNVMWAALEHTLHIGFEDIAHTELLPTSGLKTHIFVLSQDKGIESAIFNAVWVCFVLHGVPLKRSIYHHQWEQGHAIYDLNDPETIISGEYSALPSEEGVQACLSYKESVLAFLERDWHR